MNIRYVSNWKLRLFCEAYICASYSQAAENMRISQTSITKAIDDIEYVTKKTLFVRTVDGMLPTKDADELFQKIKSSLDTIENALGSNSENSLKTFAIAGNHSVCCTVFPVAIRKMKEDGCDISHFSIYNTDTQNAISLLRRQMIQAAMFPQSAIPNDIRVHASDTANAVLLVHKDHHLLKKEQITIEDLKKENFMLIDEYKINEKYRELFKDFYSNNTFNLHNADWEIIMHFVAQNLGVCPLLDIPITNPNIRKIPVANIIPPVTYNFITHQNLHETYLEALDVFVKYIKLSLVKSTYTL